MRPPIIATVLTGTLIIGVAACSSTTNPPAVAPPSSSGTTATTVARPAGPAADMSKQLTGGKGVFLGDPVPVDLAKVGYTEHEYEATGTATSYKTVGALTGDGRWTLAPAATAPYRTRVLVRMPASKARFSGNVIVEWLNVSGGVDADPEWTTLNEEITRRGDAWVGVSAQSLGVNGGPVLVKVNVPGASDEAGKGLVKIDPARYGNLTHPGDGYALDIYTQVARALRTGAGLGGSIPQRLIAAGESQSAFAMVTYYNGVQPLTKAFDGFFVHSRGAGGLPLFAG
ncbi:MAG TPA: alpha/beta hydrolase domain-containing protein, partial [Acidimicrobiia bacterium]